MYCFFNIKMSRKVHFFSRNKCPPLRKFQKFNEKSSRAKVPNFCIKYVSQIVLLFAKCLAFWKVSGFLYIKTVRNFFFAFCVYKRTRSLYIMAVIVIFIHIQNLFFLRHVYIYTKSEKNQSCLRTEYRELSWAIK